MNTLLFINHDKNYLEELQNINGHESYKNKKKEIHKLFLYQLSLLIVAIVISIYNKFICFMLFFNFICFSTYFYYFIQIIETFIEYCRIIVKFEDLIKTIYKIPLINKETIERELNNLITIYSKYYTNNENINDVYKQFLSLKKLSFISYFEEYNNIFKNRVNLYK